MVDNLTGMVDKRSSEGAVYVSPNPKQPFSRAEGCEQFCYRVEEITPKQSSLSLTTSLKLFITQMHDRSFGLIGPRLMEVVKCIIGTAFSLLHRRIIGTAFSLLHRCIIGTAFSLFTQAYNWNSF